MNQLIVAFFRLPLDVFAASVEGVSRGLKGFQEVCDAQIEPGPWTLQPDSTQACCENCSQRASTTETSGCTSSDSKYDYHQSHSHSYKENSIMSDQCETVRMIHYKIAFIKEDLEAILWDEQVVVSSETFDCGGTSFEVWKTAEFFQRLPQPIPNGWKTGSEVNYPPASFLCKDGENGYKYTGIPDQDKKYLRFFQEEEATYERRKDSQVRVLREIQKDGLKVIHTQPAVTSVNVPICDPKKPETLSTTTPTEKDKG